jgi:peroxiredoxin
MPLFKRKPDVGSHAPDFKLPSHLGSKVNLSEFHDKKNILLAFYPLDWTPI